MDHMPRFAVVLLLLALAVAPLAADEPAAPAAPAAEKKPVLKGRFDIIEDHRVLTLWGTPKERGYAHGYLLAERILAGIEHDFESVMKPFIPMYEMFVKKTIVPKFHFNERENAEIEGLFEGIKARLPADKMVIPALKRPVDIVDLKALNTFGDWYGLGCSSLAAWGELTKDGATLVGRNFDFPAFDLVLKHQYVVVRAPEEGVQGQVGICYPGCIGTLTGMNTGGVFVAIHDVRVKPSFDKTLRANVPRLLAVRRMLEQTKGPEACTQARDLARKWPTLYGNNLMVVAPSTKEGHPRAAVLEYDCRADVDEGCSMRVADAATETNKDDPPLVCLACTNHHRCREDTTPRALLEQFPRWRYPVLSSVGGKAKPEKALDVAGMFAWVGKASFPRDGKPQLRAEALKGKKRRHGTLHQVVAEPAKGRMHVKLAVLGKNIREIEPRTYEVKRLVEAAASRK